MSDCPSQPRFMGGAIKLNCVIVLTHNNSALHGVCLGMMPSSFPALWLFTVQIARYVPTDRALIGRCKRHLRRRLEIKSLNGVCRRHASGGVRGSSSSLDRRHLIISLFGLRPRQKGGREGGDRIGRDNLEALMREATQPLR